MNKILEKAHWEGLTILEDEKRSPEPYEQIIYPQIMLCYRCNNTIPEDSKFCPCCGIELYTICPKCGKKYSSQYVFCNECGTNKELYTQEQNKLKQKKLLEDRIKKDFAQELHNMEQELNNAIKVGSCPFFLNDDVQIIKTAVFGEIADFIIRFVADYTINNQNIESLDASFVAYVKNQSPTAQIKPFIDIICDMISENNELVSLETNLIGSIILAYRKLNYLHYFDYYTFKKISLK